VAWPGCACGPGADPDERRILDQGFTDAGGQPITGLGAVIMEGKARKGGGDPTIYLHDHGIQRWVVYQPISRY
jgi:hypothetical protein